MAPKLVNAREKYSFSLVNNIDRWPPFVWLSWKIFFQLSLVRNDDRWFPSRDPPGGLDDDDDIGDANDYVIMMMKMTSTMIKMMIMMMMVTMMIDSSQVVALRVVDSAWSFQHNLPTNHGQGQDLLGPVRNTNWVETRLSWVTTSQQNHFTIGIICKKLLKN